VLYLLKTADTSAPPPDHLMTREETAIVLAQAVHGASYVFPPAVGIFADVPKSGWAAPAVEQIYRDGVTAGCGTSPLLFCPGNLLTRAEMAVLLLRARYGSAYMPPPATGRIFADVPASHWAARWIEQLYLEGITAGCSLNPRQFCDRRNISAWELDVFVRVAFGTR